MWVFMLCWVRWSDMAVISDAFFKIDRIKTTRLLMNYHQTTPWQQQLQHSITTPHQLMDYANHQGVPLFEGMPSEKKKSIEESIIKTAQTYPMRLSPYYLSLIQSVGDPIWKQAIPDHLELMDDINVPDPLCEAPQSPVPSIIHRYPDRVIFLISNQCAMYCRHCMRKRNVGMSGDKITDQTPPCPLSKSGEHEYPAKADSKKKVLETKAFFKNSPIEQGLAYIAGNKKVFDVILSGGDPLLLETETLDHILARVRAVDHVQTIRIHTRTLCTLPARITENLVNVLKRYHPLYVNTHFNHPMEITDEAAHACAKLADAGISLGCQTVLLKGVNDTPEVMIDLMRSLLRIRVKPYYLHHPDAVAGTAHFRLPLEKGLDIIKAMRGHISGMAIPHYVIDLPGGHGKTPMTPDYLKSIKAGEAMVENYEGRICQYTF